MRRETRHSKDISVPRRRIDEEEEVGREGGGCYLVKTQDVKEGVDFPLVWENTDVMAYVKFGTNYVDARRFEALCSHERASKIVYSGRSRAREHETWRLRKE